MLADLELDENIAVAPEDEVSNAELAETVGKIEKAFVSKYTNQVHLMARRNTPEVKAEAERKLAEWKGHESYRRIFYAVAVFKNIKFMEQPVGVKCAAMIIMKMAKHRGTWELHKKETNPRNPYLRAVAKEMLPLIDQHDANLQATFEQVYQLCTDVAEKIRTGDSDPSRRETHSVTRAALEETAANAVRAQAQLTAELEAAKSQNAQLNEEIAVEKRLRVDADIRKDAEIVRANALQGDLRAANGREEEALKQVRRLQENSIHVQSQGGETFASDIRHWRDECQRLTDQNTMLKDTIKKLGADNNTTWGLLQFAQTAAQVETSMLKRRMADMVQQPAPPQPSAEARNAGAPPPAGASLRR